MEDTRKAMFCPYMKEMCISGWTKSMGEDEKTGERPCCRMWTGVLGVMLIQVRKLIDVIVL